MLLIAYQDDGLGGFDMVYDYIENTLDYDYSGGAEEEEVSNIDDVLDADDLVQGDGGPDTVKFSSVAQGEYQYNFAGIEENDNKGFFVTLENEDEIFDYENNSNYYDEDNYDTDYYDLYFDFLSADNSAYVFLDNNDQPTSVALEGTDYGFIIE